MIKKFAEFIKESAEWTSTSTDDVNEQDVIKFLKIIANWDDSRDSRKLKSAFGEAKALLITGNTSKYSKIINKILGGISIFVNYATAANSKQLARFGNKYRSEILVFDDAPVFQGGDCEGLSELLDSSNGFVVINTDSSYREIKKQFPEIVDKLFAV